METVNKKGPAPAKSTPPSESIGNPKHTTNSARLSTLGMAASVYARRFGFAVFPCVPRAKEPLTPHGCKDASRSCEQIDKWWGQWPNANVGIACGALSGGLFVLDIDGDDGQESLRVLERAHGELPRTPQVLTGKGVQYYFRTPVAFKNRVGLLPGIDTRSDGGYVIAPPSIHPNGKIYAWEVSARLDEVEIQPLPAWLADLLASEDSPEPKPKAASYWAALTANGVKEGGRNQAVAELAGHLLRRYVDGYVVLELIQAWNQCRNQPPLDPPEVHKTVESVAALEAHRREGVVPHV